jgi:two-component system CheB/CheR fusion protein
MAKEARPQEESNAPEMPDRRGAKHPCPVVGIGASAGGLDALQALFSHMPADSGMAFVLVQHHHPRHETQMPELLARYTRMPVQLAADRTVIARNHIYVIPPGATLTIDGCTLYLSQERVARGRRTPIDHFFRSLAQDQGDDAVGIVLSGAGTDGALGLKLIKEQGGLTMVQSPPTAAYDSMPRAALLTGAVDQVLPVEEMPARLMEYVGQLREARGGGGTEGFREQLEDHLDRIATLLRRKTGHDFSRYKKSTLIRRIRRRMQLLRAGSVAAYLERLKDDPHEPDQLFHDLLIGITHYFRDPEAFQALAERVVPKLFDGKGMDDQVRVWVPGCATGEEAYSLAILLHEHLDGLDDPPHVQIFATDIDEHALETARQGWYPESIASQMSKERLERYFLRHGNLYQVSREIREMCLFSLHNLITDPPFSRLDLISCRNLLIYLEMDLQKKLVPLCHYALRQGGYLFLGPSESVASHPELFRPVDKRQRIFQRKDTLLRPAVTFPLTDRGRSAPFRPWAEGHPRRPAHRESDVSKVFEAILLDSYAPPCVVVNERNDIVYNSPRTGRYLELPPGAPNLNLIEMAREELRLDLRTAIHKAVATGKPVAHEEVPLDGGGPRLDLIVRPLPELGEDSGLYMVVFQERPARESGRRPDREDPAGTQHDLPPGTHGTVVQRLEAELRTTKDHLQAALEELESSNEELVSSNEELLSINEELQSANEELQTSKEELQSLNEELESVNAELRKKIAQLDRAHSDLQNLFQSTQIATVFVDRDLHIQKFTPAATAVFRLIETDVGRPISDVVPRFSGAELVVDIKEVVRTLSPREREVRVKEEGAWYILRVLPYRTLEDVIDGVVITFVDVTDLKRAQEQTARLAAIVESSQEAIIGKNLDRVILSWNGGAERLYGYKAEEALGRPITFVIPPERQAEMLPVYERLKRREEVGPLETERIRKDGRRLSVTVAPSPVYDESGELVGIASIEQDITDRKLAEEAVRQSEERYRALVTAHTSVVWRTDAEGRFGEPQPSWQDYTGQSAEQAASWGWAEAIHAEDRERIRALWRQALAERSLYEVEGRLWCAPRGEYRYVISRAVPLLDAQSPDGEVREWVGTITDIDDRRRAEEALQEAARRKDEFLAVLGHELRNPLAPVRNSLHVLAQPNATPEQGERARRTIERQVVHLTRLVDDLLDVSRISRGAILLRRERLDLVELVRREVEDRRGGMQAAGIDLELDLPAGPAWVHGDPTRLAQSVGNILQNAIKFTGRGGRVSVSVRPDPDEETVTVEIRDTGIGISPELMSRLFEPFIQGDRSLDRSRGGLGLGLALVKSLVVLHGGTVEARSAGEGKGAELILRLPLAAAPDLARPVEEKPEGNHCHRCLIIEDNRDAADSLRLLLELSGHEVDVAYHGLEGVEKARSFQPEVVLCDIGLPDGMDGYAVARALRADSELGPVRLIALTGYGQAEDQRRALEAGFDAHLTKPADPDGLRRLLSSLP